MSRKQAYLFLLLPLLFGAQDNNSRRCSNGPYLFDDACLKTNQGVGSTINKVKLQIILSEAYNLTMIPIPACFESTEHNTSFFQVLGWKSATDCTIDDVIEGRDGSNSLPIFPVKWNTGKGLENALKSLCDTISSSEPLEAAMAELGEINQIFKTGNLRFKSTAIYAIEREYYSFNMESYQCTRSFIVDSYHNRQQIDLAAGKANREITFNRDKYNIALHFRYGDTAQKDPNYPAEPNWDVNYPEQRRLPLQHGIQILRNILGPSSVLNPADCVINFYSEGEMVAFQQLQEAFPETMFFLGNESTAVTDLDHMASADILIGGPSSFSSLAAALNVDGVNIVPKTCEKFIGINNSVGNDLILKGDLTEFNSMVCHSSLYVSSSAPKLVGCN